MGLDFPNPVGLAAGFDKDAADTDALATLGFGFLEVGAITPKPQLGNPSPRLFRLPQARALINRMGFNNCGAEAAAQHLSHRRNRCIIGINIGKNATTPLENALDDYLYCLRSLYVQGDFFTINVSSPNTLGLQQLQQKDSLTRLLSALVTERDALTKQHGKRSPLAVKLSSDLDETALQDAALAVRESGVDGVIATNTTSERPAAIKHLAGANETGGLSGQPLAARATAMITSLRTLLPKKTAIIGVGGIFSGDDAREKLSAGADLIQIYTGLIYEGPCLPCRILAELKTHPPAPTT
jgi:dihydroorotate dehydrogenase